MRIWVPISLLGADSRKQDGAGGCGEKNRKGEKLTLGSGGHGWGHDARFHGDLQAGGGLSTGKMMQGQATCWLLACCLRFAPGGNPTFLAVCSAMHDAGLGRALSGPGQWE